MPRLTSRRRRRSDTGDAEDSGDVWNGFGSQASDSSKRRRLDSESDSDGDTGPSAPSAGLVNGVSNGDIMQDFQPGAIVRVSVQNFVTYEKAEFFPGPHLNMVIGPNGTGKSSLVCAICLGLGYSPKHLGRAGSVKEFVKHGKDIATIEIELQKKPRDRSNYVIKVQIRREQNSQKWWLNGKETSHKKIQELMKSMKIQVDNLCQFLPQDRVVEFAACTPVDLLHETLRAAAPEEMLLWQSQLQEMHKEKKGLADAVHSDVDALRILENRQQGLQADVDRIREREEIQEKVENLQSALVFAKYSEARENHSKARDRKKEAERTLQRLESESGPSLEAVNMKQEYAQQVRAVVPAKERALKDAENAAQSAARDIHGAAELVKEMNNRLEAERKGFESKKKDLAASRSKITAFQADLKNRPTDFNAADWNQKIRAEEHNLREMEAEQRQVSADRDATKERVRPMNVDIRKIKTDIDAFDTQQGQQMALMRRQFPEASNGWEWIKEHQSEFEKEVFGPPMISCSMKDERYADQIQALLQMDDLLCFTAQTKNDYKKLTDQLYRVMSLSVVVRTCSNPLSAFKAPVDRAQMAELGLDGFAIDYLDGPEPVLAMLCSEKRLHMSGVSLNDHNEQAYDRLINNGKINQWAAGRQSFTIRRRREYGPQAMTTVTKNIQKGRFWTSQPVDMQEKREMERRLTELQGEKGALKEEHDRLQQKLDTIEEQKKEISEKITALRNEKSALQKEFQKWQSLPVKIESEERQKAMHEEAMRDARKNMQEIQYEWDKAVLERAKLVIKHKKLTDKIREAHLALIEAKIWLIEANSDVEGLKERNASIMAQLEEERRNVQVATEETNRTKEIGRRLGEDVRELISRDPDRRDLYTQLAEGKSSHEVELEIAAEEAKLELIHAANPNVIREFERRAEEITRLKHKMEGANEKLETLNRQLARVMSKFEPKLEELVSQINDAFAYNFEQISCAGEVRVHKEEDFSQWALDIMVKFRENEALQQLTAHRQSGGERAVSTIFYLMALQSLAQSPFRVVDEINQGMDPRNERMVHERMVEIACREHTSQYFLITPKLLTGLRYDPKMRVLCIASGEYMPKEGRKVDFARCLKIQKRLMAAG
ncbi:RecF/RecN/SMC and AAA ATPase domain protein [Metarhizium robertsii]|uniref:Structural maintenance of chromosomes protein 5 n=2 Tax=Metarhizium robertsii TaxID=568076 RepID=E9F525_METRA|nr:structural maintenance of chromosome complex subunit SmcA [Metarhizium robertsii ARSEF 23]EFY97078.1 structural maintenance of chromosome complex subunit SmcA [Metarhizium robertsii ARSEF 23]EXV00631.1 RecF/RecN/SMC and AAA ATPase domain protein [Metarhizium robertsii]